MPDEATIRGEIFHSLELWGQWPITTRDAYVCPFCKKKVLPKGSRPDIMVMSVAVEVKVFKGNRWNFKKLTAGQRAYLDWFANTGRPAFLALATTEGRAGSKEGRRLWFVPWLRWRVVEDLLVQQGEKSIIVHARDAHEKAFRDSFLDADTMLENYEMTWAGDRTWLFPEELMGQPGPSTDSAYFQERKEHWLWEGYPEK